MKSIKIALGALMLLWGVGVFASAAQATECPSWDLLMRTKDGGPGTERPWPLEWRKTRFELADGEFYTLIGTISAEGGKAYFIVDTARQPWLANKRRMEKEGAYPLTVKKAVVDTFAGRLVKLRVGARGAIRANTTAGAYEITLRAMEDPTVVEDICGE
jgi:hypothetical protein